MSFPANSSLTKSAADAAEEIAKTAILARLQKEAAPTLLGTIADFVEKNPAPFVGAGIGAGIGGLASLSDEEVRPYWPVSVLGGAAAGAGTGLLRQEVRRWLSRRRRNSNSKLDAFRDFTEPKWEVRNRQTQYPAPKPWSQQPQIGPHRPSPSSSQRDRDKLIRILLDAAVKRKQAPMQKGSGVDWKQYVDPVVDFVQKNPAPFVGAGIGAGVGGLASLSDEETRKYWPVNVLGGATIGAGTGLLRQVLQRQNTRNENLKLKALSDSAKTRMDISRPLRPQQPPRRAYRQFPVSTQRERDELIKQLLDDLIKLRQDPMQKGSGVDWKQYVDPVVDFVQKNPAPFIGAGVGAGVGGLASLTSEQRRKHMLSNMLSGGLAGGGIGMGAHLLMNNGDIAKQLVPKQKAPAQKAPAQKAPAKGAPAPAPAQGAAKPKLPGSQTGPRSTPWSPSNSSPEAAKKDLEWAEGHLEAAGQQHEGWGGAAVRAGTGVGAAGIEANVAARHLNPLGREQSAAQDIWRRLNAGGEEAKSLSQVGKRLAQQNLSPAEIVDQIRGVKAQQPWSLKRLWGNASVPSTRPAPAPNPGYLGTGGGGQAARASASTIPREALEQLAREGRKLRPVRGLGLRGRLGVYGGFAGLSYWLDALARQRARELAAERLNILNQMSSGTTP